MFFPYIGLCKKNVTPPGLGYFWPQGYNVNKLGRSSLGDASYQIQRL